MAEILYAEITGNSAVSWLRIDPRKREDLKGFRFVTKIDGSKIFFSRNGLDEDDKSDIRELEFEIISLLQRENPHQRVRSVSITYVINQLSLQAVISRIPDFPQRFAALTFGSDAAEQDDHLLTYFLETPAYDRASKYQKGIIIGPKGSGKSSILKALSANNANGQTIEITPEVFATSMLRTIVEAGAGTLEEERAFVATWEFSILFEVFKQLRIDPKGLPKPAHDEVVAFLKRNSEFEHDDLFSRFIRYFQKIQSIKVGNIEIAAKTKELQTLFALEPIYNLILKIRKYMRKTILILIDELDQGWDNSDHSNRFLAGLLQAAVQIQNMGINAHVIVFVRSEIFDLVRTKLAQLDKIRASIERLRWSDGELMNLIFKRIAHHFRPWLDSYEPRDLLGLIFERTENVLGFEYILSRTTRRPREVLQFTRLAHQTAIDLKSKGSVSTEAILKAEEEFSVWKLEHVCSEYLHIHPELEALLRAFRGYQVRLDRPGLELLIFEFQENLLSAVAWQRRDFGTILQILYQVEFLGAKRIGKAKGLVRELDDFEFYYEAPSPNLKAVDEFLVHPAFWKALELSR